MLRPEADWYDRAMTGSASAARASSADPSMPWIRGPAWDLGLLNLGWIPFYVLLVFWLGIDGTWSAGGTAGAGREPGLGVALTIALGLSYVHRHYTFFIVYGDAETFAAERRAFAIGPAVAFVVVALAYRFHEAASFELPTALTSAWTGRPVTISAWAVVLIVTGAWNVWHTLMQRHGIHRVYAGLTRRVTGGVDARGIPSPTHGRRDRRLLWSLVLLTTVVVLTMRAETFAGIGNARRLLAVARPITEGPVAWGLGLGAAALAVGVALDWGRHELASTMRWRQRLPRLAAWASTCALLLVFWVHGPVVGYLCFGTAHAIEYVAFVHHFGARKFAGDERRDLLALVLRHAAISAPVIIALLLAAYWLLLDARGTELFLVYYTATSLLHFWFDGKIWKVSRPRVACPLGF